MVADFLLMPSSASAITLRDIFEPPEDVGVRPRLHMDAIARYNRDIAGGPSVILDRFSDADASCGFLRLPSGPGVTRLVLEGTYGIQHCPCGGWLLLPNDPELAIYWVPRPPVFRVRDSNGRILCEEPSQLTGFRPDSHETTVDIARQGVADLDCVFWRLQPSETALLEELTHALVLEQQPQFMLASHTSLRGPADLYTYLIHGHVYENRFDHLRKRKICSELEAYSTYIALHGLEAATNKRLYRLLKRQVVHSVLDRQAPDGGWYHGEWTDFMESHYRFHSAAMLLLEATIEENANDRARGALAMAASVMVRSTDRTDIGLWFLHDSLEQSREMTEQSGMRWIPSRVLGKSPTNKMILNTHLDAIVALDRYRELTGDRSYSTQTDSALGAARRLLALHPAEALYRFVYWAVGLTLLPSSEAQRLSLPLRLARRFTRLYVLPQLHRLKRRFPRLVMPGGLIERHLSRLHFGTNYHSVNVSDLVRVWRRFPAETFGPLLDQAVRAVTETSLLQYWGETNQEQALGYWVEALFQLCTLRPERVYRRHLAEAMLSALDSGLGLPPSLLGAHPEIVSPGDRLPCPSPTDARLRVANLGRKGHRELLVVNPADAALELAWESDVVNGLVWASADDRSLGSSELALRVPARGWMLGREG